MYLTPFSHQRRATLIHDLVDELSLDVKDWGTTDAEHPREIVDLMVAIAPYAIPAAAAIISAWIMRPERKAVENKGVLGVKFRRPDGTELSLTAEAGNQSEIAALIESFLRQGG